MQQSSESIGAFAAALAKAQCELTNPEKSLVGVISSPSTRDGDRAFRYAPLSSGLDIIRKTLGSHEIAVVQTTAVDKEAGLIRLTTILAHSSGEWIASDWPVCPISETAAPHRMGAALTYARRYALFTLVGIAGEDDLDAPDLNGSTEQEAPPTPIRGNQAANGHALDAGSVAKGRRQTPPSRLSPPTVLAPDQSAVVRERLLSEVDALASADAAAIWAQRSLAAKNTLIAADARLVEAAFGAKITAIGDGERSVEDGGGALAQAEALPGQKLDHALMPTAIPVLNAEPTPTRRHRLAPKTIRVRDKAHRRF